MRNSSKTFGKLQISLFLLLAISFSALPAQAKYGGGTGEPNDPYLIYDANQMNAIGADTNDWDNHFKLMADIDLSGYTGTEFNIIGAGRLECTLDLCWIDGTPFTGVFDGNGHTISNFTYEYIGDEFVGLFGYVDGESAQIKNLFLRDVDIDVQHNGGDPDYGATGSLIGELSNGTVIGCYIQGGNLSGGSRVGGMVGVNSGTIANCHSSGNFEGEEVVGGLVGNSQGTITNCYSTGSVSGSSYVGGLVGANFDTISNCYSNGNVSGTTNVGGLVGMNGLCIPEWRCYPGTISNCYSTGSVTGNKYLGGLVGYNLGTVSNCYSTGSVSGNWAVGGLVGYNLGTVSNSYSTGSVSGGTYVGGLVGVNNGHAVSCFWDVNSSGQPSSAGGTGKTTAEMKDPNTFIGWWCGAVWMIDAGIDYPRLWWENAQGELITTTATYAGGSGEPNDPYLIETAEQLNSIGGLVVCHWDKHFKLNADIDLDGYTGTSFNIIGTWPSNPFTGVFDGNGHTISNFTYNSTGIYYIGLFGYVDDPNAEIKNLGLIDPNVNAGTGDEVGSLVGRLQNGSITDCNSVGGNVSGNYYVGGLVGYNDGGTLSNSYATGSVSGGDRVGGLVGYNDDGLLSNSYATGSVSGGSYVGGLVGYNATGTVSDCYAAGSISGYWVVGGLVGRNRSSTVSNSYAVGDVNGVTHVGGLVGNGSSGDYTKSFWDNTVNPGLNGIGNTSDPHVIGESTANMQTKSTFTDAGWDFVGEIVNGPNDIWDICEGTNYPKFVWQIPPLGDFVCPDGVNFFDFSFFAGRWAEENCAASNDCDGRDLDLLGSVDIKDLRIFADNWLAGF